MGDTYFFVNELVKTQGTSLSEQQLYIDYLSKKKQRDKKYGRSAVACVFLPYFYACFSIRGWAWKFLVFYGLLNSLNAVYDCGMYANFFVHGPGFLKQLMAQDSKESFSPIQTRLFMKWCAS